MQSSQRPPVIGLIILVVLALAGCGSSQARADSMAFSRANNKSEQVAALEPIATTADLKPRVNLVAPVEVGELTSYKHANELFSIDVPANWTMTNSSLTGEAVLIWNDPGKNALIIVDVFADSNIPPYDDLSSYLRKFLNFSYGDSSGFELNAPQPQQNGSILIPWRYTIEFNAGANVEMLSNSFIAQHGDKVSILTMTFPSAQLDALSPSFNAIINSYRVNAQSEIPS
ncbi:MAG: hypothetical protein MI924_34315 [Chloroflexales bacterium]|nr:hypothetical protein [Chloroflexales bacterium]